MSSCSYPKERWGSEVMAAGLSVVLVEEGGDRPQAGVLLLHVRHVAGVLEDMPSDVGDAVGVRPDGLGGGLVVISGAKQGGLGAPVEPVDDGPVLQRPDHV